MPDTPTVSDELLEYLADRFPARALTPRARRCLVDDVLAWLGHLDPDADPLLLAHHLRTSRVELEAHRADGAALRARVEALALALGDVLARFDERGHPGEDCYRTSWVTTGDLERWREVLAGGR